MLYSCHVLEVKVDLKNPKNQNSSACYGDSFNVVIGIYLVPLPLFILDSPHPQAVLWHLPHPEEKCSKPASCLPTEPQPPTGYFMLP